jgi:hypothetical protein
MKKTEYRSMTARELRHFLERFREEVRLKVVCTDDDLRGYPVITNLRKLIPIQEVAGHPDDGACPDA